MLHSDLIIGKIYIDVNDKKVPLMFISKKLINLGLNNFVYQCKFKTIINEQNKNYHLPNFINKNFSEDGQRDDIKPSISQ